MVFEEKVKNAVRIFRHVATTGKSDFSISDAMKWAGIAAELADTETYKANFSGYRLHFEQKYGPPPYKDDDASVANRFRFLWHNTVAEPEGITKKTQALVMELAGAQNRGPGKLYVRCSRLKGDKGKDEATPVDVNPIYSMDALNDSGLVSPLSEGSQGRESFGELSHVIPPQGRGSLWPPALRRSLSLNRLSQQIMSPLSTGFSNQSSPSSASYPSSTINNDMICISIPLSDALKDIVEDAVAEQVAAALALEAESAAASTGSGVRISLQNKRQDVAKAVQRLTTVADNRLTSKARQANRQTDKLMKDIKNTGYKVGTLLLDCVTKQLAPFKHLDTRDKVAEAVNGLFGVELVSGRQLSEGVRKGLVAKSPPRVGRPIELEPEEFKDICTAFLTLSAIEQVNCDADRHNRTQLTSLLGSLIAEKYPNRNEVKLYETMMQANSRSQNVAIIDNREALRVKWLTYVNQKKHHENWEEFLVDHGFAREPMDEEERVQLGHVVFREGQAARVINFDEMSISLDGSQTSKGGRPSTTPTNPDLPESGQQTQKSDKTATIVFGVTGKNEAIPPFFIFPTKSANKENYKLRWEVLQNMPQIVGQYGYSTRRAFDVGVGMNPKGGMNEEMFHKYVTQLLMVLYPNAEDVSGKRVVLKSDSGPGRLGIEYRFQAKAEGVYLYPGLPNGTEAGQECDQLFSYLKTLTGANQEKLYEARVRTEGDSATLSLKDSGLCVFGGTVILVNGEVLTLEPAFDMAMDREHIKMAQEKCGYCPATRNALTSSRIRHEAVFSENGELDEEADPYGALLLELETQNHKACDRLVQMWGHTSANTICRRDINRISERQTEARMSVVTLPHTRERQELLTLATRAGDWFRVTNGGGPMNCSDALLGIITKNLDEELEKLEQKRADCWKLVEKKAAADAVLADEARPYANWRMDEFKTMVIWKQGLKPLPPGQGVSGKTKAQLKALWEQKYSRMEAPTDEWTEQDDARLERLNAGDISMEESAIYGDAIEANNEFISGRLKTISHVRRKAVLADVFGDLSPLEKESLLEYLGTI